MDPSHSSIKPVCGSHCKTNPSNINEFNIKKDIGQKATFETSISYCDRNTKILIAAYSKITLKSFYDSHGY